MAAFRKRLEKVVGDKHEEVMGRMGAIMATGLAVTLLKTACKCTRGCLVLAQHSHSRASCQVRCKCLTLLVGHVKYS